MCKWLRGSAWHCAAVAGGALCHHWAAQLKAAPAPATPATAAHAPGPRRSAAARAPMTQHRVPLSALACQTERGNGAQGVSGGEGSLARQRPHLQHGTHLPQLHVRLHRRCHGCLALRNVDLAPSFNSSCCPCSTCRFHTRWKSASPLVRCGPSSASAAREGGVPRAQWGGGVSRAHLAGTTSQ